MTRLFRFAQFDFAGRLAVADGRYVLRGDEGERVLVVETIGAPPPTGRRRRKPREAQADDTPTELPLARVTSVRASETLANEAAAERWLEHTSADEEEVDRLLEEGIDDVNRALHAQAIASGDPHPQVTTPTRAVAMRVGFGSGEQLADGLYAAAHQVDPGRRPGSRRRQRDEEMRPQQRVAALLGGRERPDICEILLLRARADLDAGRDREAALQLRIGLEALLVELHDALSDPGHEEDMATLESRRHDVGELANAALRGDLDAAQLDLLRDAQAVCERVLRRRRILAG
ncbi:MAG TPA: hypothetical protein VG898_08270 [Solirubrobacterales bacterium]|nr:hypothetical protein [Solirubrobacterales bacterium]